MIKMIFKMIGAADAAANLLWEFSIAAKNDAIHINSKKGKVILVRDIAKFILLVSSTKPGAIIDTNAGIKIWTIRTKKNKDKNKRLNMLLAKSFDLFFPLINSDE